MKPATPSDSSRILVVDDSITVRMDLGESLQEAGYEVDMAATLAEARMHLDRGGHGLVLLDVQLPDGDGVDFLAVKETALGPPQIARGVRTKEGEQPAGEAKMRQRVFTRALLRPAPRAPARRRCRDRG